MTAGLVGPVPVTGVPESPDAAVDRLCRRMRDVCASAVDPLEIAAALEAEAGLTVAVLRTRYGCADVFTLAEEMFRRTVRWPTEPAPHHAPWTPDPRTYVGHAVLYGLPAASYAVAAPLLTGTPALTAVLVAVLVPWTLAQALAHLGHARLSRLDPDGAARVLRLGLAAETAAVGAALAVGAVLAPVGAAVLVLAAAQGVYLVAATVLLVQKAERWLFAALWPGALASVAYLLAGRPAVLADLLWLPLVASAVAAAAAVVAVTRTPERCGRVAPSRAEWVGAASRAQCGLAVAGLLVFPTAVSGLGGGTAVSATAVLALPLLLSVGAAEWSRDRYRGDVRALLERCRTPDGFGAAARRLLLDAVLRYLGAAAALVAVTVAALNAAGIAPAGGTVLLVGSYLALGGALFLALLLQAHGAGAWSGIACGAALGLEAALVLAGGADVPVAQLVASTLLLGGSAVVATTVLSRVGCHL